MSESAATARRSSLKGLGKAAMPRQMLQQGARFQVSSPLDQLRVSLLTSTVASPTASHLPHSHTTNPQANLGAATLLALSDSVRKSLARHGNFGPCPGRLSFFLELAILEETEGRQTLDFETIKVARLDKLVADLTECGEMSFHLAPRFVHDVVTAKKLEKAWRVRFRFNYFMIDEIRIGHLAARWRLREQTCAHTHYAQPSLLTVSEPGTIPEIRSEVARFKPGG
jgi:hypothetical protein